MNTGEYIKDRIFKASAGLSKGIFVMLGIGLLLKNIGELTEFEPLILVGTMAIQLTAPAIGAGIAIALSADMLVVFSAMIAATVGAAAIKIGATGLMITTGEPVGATLAAIVATYVGKRIFGKTPLDMMVVPLLSVLVGGIFGFYVSKLTTPALVSIGELITHTTNNNGVVASIVIAVAWGIFVISPASSVMMALALNLNDIASAAALIGCTAHFVGFTIMSYKEASPGALMAIAICTPKVQLPNITKNPMLLIPPTIAAAISAPIAVNMLGLYANKQIAGMGLSSFVAPLQIFVHEGAYGLLIFFVGGIVIPSIVSYIVYKIIKKAGYIKPSDLFMS